MSIPHVVVSDIHLSWLGLHAFHINSTGPNKQKGMQNAPFYEPNMKPEHTCNIKIMISVCIKH